MPVLTHHASGIRGQSADDLHLGMAFHAVDLRQADHFTKVPAECQVLLVRQLLSREQDHLVVGEGLADLPPDFRRERLAQIHA